mgnify:CR=1 FL=1
MMNVVTALEINFGVFVEDDDINAEVFATIETLANYVNQRKSRLRIQKMFA